jgi:S-DNA-T family DNA segregation ATPase FtsK/SpoIIIE
VRTEGGLKIIAEEKEEKATLKLPKKKGNYLFPSLTLLSEAPVQAQRSNEDYQTTAQALVKTLEEFNIKVNPGEVHTGPVITRYEVTPAAGVRVEKIASLDRNIAMGLKANFCTDLWLRSPERVASVLKCPTRLRNQFV